MSGGDSLSPYKGLTPFEDSELDVLFFFGRERERELVEANLMASRLTVLYGETGVGKSSVLRAGVAHHLRTVARKNLEERGEPGLAVVVFDSWRDEPLKALRGAVGDAVTLALGGSLRPPDEEGSLAEALRMWQQVLDGDLYVILDQAEEYFLYQGGEDGAGTFAVDFPAVVNSSDLRVNFLLAIREDALAKLDVFKGRIPNVLGNYLRLEHLDPQAARAAIVEPISQYNWLVAEEETVEIEPELVDAVLEQVVAGKVGVGQAGRGAVEGGNDVVRIETPYLQLVMERLWDEERDVGSRTLRVETLRRLGGAEHIVHDHVDEALTELTPAERNVAARMFDHLVTPSGTKIAHEVGDLAKYAGAGTSDLLPVLTKLGNERILRSVAGNGARGSRYEIFHDVLAEPVLAWKAGHDAHRELDRQREESERRHRRLLRLMILAAVAVLVMSGVTIFALTQRSEARSQARLARARELAATAVSQLPVDPELSLALAIESARLKRTREAEDVLRQALFTARERAILPSGRAVRAVSFSPDGSLVLTASDDGSARIWRADGTLVHTLRQGGPVTAASFAPAATLVLTAGRDGTARIWRMDTGELTATLRHGGPVTSATFSRDGRVVLTTSEDGTARVWTTATGAPLLVVKHGRPVLSGSLSGDGRHLVTVSSDSSRLNLRARLFDLPRGRLVHELPAKGVTTASFNPGGTLLVTGSQDHTAAIWQVHSGVRLHLLADHQGGVTDAVFGPGGRLVVTTSSDGATRVWDVRTGRRLALLLGHANAVNSASFSRDGKFLVTASSDGTARVWEAATGRPEAVAVLRGHTDSVAGGAFSPDGRAVATASADGTARIWEPGTAPELHVLAVDSGPVWAASFSHDNRLVLTAGDDGTARILTAGGRLVHVLRHPGPVTSATFSPDGKLALTAGADRTLRVWRTDNGALLRVVRDVSAGPLALSADGRLLAAPAASGAIRIWSTATFRPLRELNRGGPFTAASFSPAGPLIATAGQDKAARIWNAENGALVRTLRGHTDVLTDVEFSPDGKLLVTASRDHDARIWEVATGKMTVLLRGHFGAVFGASFSPDGRWVATAGPTTAGLWQASNGRLLFYLRGHMEPLTSASFTPDGKRILTSSRDGTLRIYTCQLCGEIDDLLAVAEARLAALSRPLTPAERERYLSGSTAARKKSQAARLVAGGSGS
jgi:WD40 repeat protein